jgi:hypothetical protein
MCYYKRSILGRSRQLFAAAAYEVANKLYESPQPLYSKFASDATYEKLSFIQ